MELLCRWRVVGRAGVALDPDELCFLGKKAQQGAMSQWSFLTEHVVADIDRPKDTGKIQHKFRR